MTVRAHQQNYGVITRSRPSAPLNFMRLGKSTDDLSPVWDRSDIRDCVAVGTVLVCETYTRRDSGPFVRNADRSGPRDRAHAVAHVRGPDDFVGDESVVGEWNGDVVIVRRQREDVTGKLTGLQPRDGRTIWSLTVPLIAATVGGDVLVTAIERPGQPARAIAYRMP